MNKKDVENKLNELTAEIRNLKDIVNEIKPKKQKNKLEDYAFNNAVYSRSEIMDILVNSFPDRRLSGIYEISAAVQIQRFQLLLRELGKENARKILNEDVFVGCVTCNNPIRYTGSGQYKCNKCNSINVY
jgi:hypothetical protein